MPLLMIKYDSRLGSYGGALFFTLWIVQRLYFDYEAHFSWSIYALTWWLITFQYVIFVVSYLTRHEAKERANGFMEVVFPFICAAMPFTLIADYPFKPATCFIHRLEWLSVAMLVGGTLIIIIGISYLRRSFSIMTEVRQPIVTGIYRITRHPMYLGSIISASGTLLQFWSWWNWIVFLTFCLFQYYRAAREERKIIRVFPEYGVYASQVGWLWKLGRRNGA
jgi:protein-S-isoprenylcysteine O-methyltransferase Ste14